MSNTIVLSHYQNDIIRAVIHDACSLIIKAAAGSGKSYTIKLACKYVPIGNSILFVAFNSHIVDAIRPDIPSHIECKTCHSLGLRAVRQFIPSGHHKLQNFKYHDLCDGVVKQNYGHLNWGKQREVKDQLVQLLNFARNTLTPTDPTSLANMIVQYGLDVKDDDLLKYVPGLLEQGIEIFKHTGEVDFTDMLWLVIALDLECKQYDYIFIDEIQDLNALQHAVIKKCCHADTKVIGVGDEWQCQPGETMVSRKIGSPVPIALIQPGEKVLSFIPNEGRYATGIVKGVAFRHYKGDMIHIEWNDRITQCTPEHKFFVRWNKECYQDYYCVYLMQFDNYFRIGKTKLLREGGGGSFGLSCRMRTEHAERGWILKICATEKEAVIQETILSCKFGIPTITFREGIYGQNHKYKILFDQYAIDRIFMEIGDMYQHANQLLNSLGMRIDIPFAYKGSFKKMGKTTTFLVNACNIFSKFMCLPDTDMLYCKSDGAWTNKEKRFPSYSPIKSCRRSQFEGNVFSLEIDKGTYIADQIPTHNSMYGFSGALPDSMQRFQVEFNAKPLPLSICYRCPKSHLRLARHVDNDRTEWRDDAPEGHVEFMLQKDIDLKVQTGDLILCRLTAPLISLCIKLIAKGVSAKVLGRNIGKSLTVIIGHVMDNNAAWEDFIPNLQAYENAQIQKLHKRKDGEYQVESLRDKIEAIGACHKSPLFDTTSLDTFKRKLEALFSEDQTPITLCTIHRAKGLEADSVFLINDSGERDCMPLIYKNQQPHQLEQECNIVYVALTRAKKSLYICSTTQQASARHKDFYQNGGIRRFTGKKENSVTANKADAYNPKTGEIHDYKTRTLNVPSKPPTPPPSSQAGKGNGRGEDKDSGGEGKGTHKEDSPPKIVATPSTDELATKVFIEAFKPKLKKKKKVIRQPLGELID